MTASPKTSSQTERVKSATGRVRWVIPLAACALLASFWAGSSDSRPSTASAASHTDRQRWVESYENGWGGWKPDHYIECESQDPPCSFEWAIERSQEQARHGSHSLKATLDGRWDDGTIWVVKAFPASTVDVRIDLSFWLWSPEASDANQWNVVAYVGPVPPIREEDFTIVGQTNQVAGWAPYRYAKDVSGGSDTVWVAFGYSATWEVERTYFLDLSRVTIEPLLK